MNDIVIVAFLCMIIAQVVKIPFYYIKTGKWNFAIALSTGSMPSSHTAVVVGTAIATAFQAGLDSAVFGVALVYASITIHDAVKVRGESGKQAQVINIITRELQLLYESLDLQKGRAYREKKLKELIGHTYSEVLGGVVTGALVAYIYFM